MRKNLLFTTVALLIAAAVGTACAPTPPSSAPVPVIEAVDRVWVDHPAARATILAQHHTIDPDLPGYAFLSGGAAPLEIWWNAYLLEDRHSPHFANYTTVDWVVASVGASALAQVKWGGASPATWPAGGPSAETCAGWAMYPHEQELMGGNIEPCWSDSLRQRAYNELIGPGAMPAKRPR